METEKGERERERAGESVADVTGNGKAVSGQLKERRRGEEGKLLPESTRSVAKLREFPFSNYEKLRNIRTFILL